MNAVSEIQTKSSRIHPLVAVAAVSVILACGTGIAAMTGLLPSSKATATTVTASPFGSANGHRPVAQASQPVIPQAASLPRAVRGHHPTPVRRPAPAQESTSYAPPSAPAYDPYAGEVTAVNAVQSAQPTTGLGAIGGAVVGGLRGHADRQRPRTHGGDDHRCDRRRLAATRSSTSFTRRRLIRCRSA